MILIPLIVLLLPLAGDWQDVQRIPKEQKVEVATRDGSYKRGAHFVSATADALVIREKSGERSIARTDVRRVLASDPSRRIRNGAIWTAIGAGAGLGIGFAVCPYCGNEGHGDKYVGPGVAIGAGLGALAFIPAPYRTVYKSK